MGSPSRLKISAGYTWGDAVSCKWGAQSPPALLTYPIDFLLLFSYSEEIKNLFRATWRGKRWQTKSGREFGMGE